MSEAGDVRLSSAGVITYTTSRIRSCIGSGPDNRAANLIHVTAFTSRFVPRTTSGYMIGIQGTAPPPIH